MKLDHKKIPTLLEMARQNSCVRILFTINSLVVSQQVQEYARLILLAAQRGEIVNSEAFTGIQKFAAEGDREAQFWLGFLHLSGILGIYKINVAKYWFVMASSQKHGMAKFFLDELKMMSDPWENPDLKVIPAVHEIKYFASVERRPSYAMINDIKYVAEKSSVAGAYGAVSRLLAEKRRASVVSYVVKKPLDMDSDCIDDWKREAHFFNKAHPHSPCKLIHSFNSHFAEWRLVMPLLGGMSLKAALRNSGSVSETLEILIAILDELVRLHQLGIVHRDVHRDNFRISIVDSKYIAQAIDFGKAHSEGSRVKSHMGKFQHAYLMEKVITLKYTTFLEGKEITTEELHDYKKTYVRSAKYQILKKEKIAAWKIKYPYQAPECVEEETYTVSRSQDLYAYVKILMRSFPDYHHYFGDLIKLYCSEDIKQRPDFSHLRAALIKTLSVIKGNVAGNPCSSATFKVK